MNWITPYMDWISLVLQVFAGLTLFWILWISVQWIRLRNRPRLSINTVLGTKEQQIILTGIESITIERTVGEGSPDREYVFRVTLKDINGTNIVKEYNLVDGPKFSEPTVTTEVILDDEKAKTT